MSTPRFAVPINERYFEDYVVGPTYEFGPISVSEAEIIDFGRKFDPQYIHTDPEKAALGPFGGLIASGWHTASLMMRLYADNYISSVAAIASPVLTNFAGSGRFAPATRYRFASRSSVRAALNPSRISEWFTCWLK